MKARKLLLLLGWVFRGKQIVVIDIDEMRTDPEIYNAWEANLSCSMRDAWYYAAFNQKKICEAKPDREEFFRRASRNFLNTLTAGSKRRPLPHQ